MAIKHHRRNGRCYLELCRTYRRGDKVVSEHVRYLGLCPEHSPKDAVSVLNRIEHRDSRRAGAVRLLWQLAQDLGFRARSTESVAQNPPRKGSPRVRS